MNIKIVIEDKIATAPDNAVIVCGNNDYVIAFLFDEDWDGYEAKTARFTYIKNGKSNYIDEPFVGDTCPVPMLSNVSRVDIGVYAGDLRTTTAAVVKCKKSILCKGGTPDEPDEDVYGKIMEMINEKLIDPNTPIDQAFNPESENPQSGKAVMEALSAVGELIEIIGKENNEKFAEMYNGILEIIQAAQVENDAKFATKDYVTEQLGVIDNGRY